MKLLLAGCAALAALSGLGACGDDDHREPSQTVSISIGPASRTPIPTATPATTPIPTCQPLSPDVGFPVMVGRIGDEPCVLWAAAPSAGTTIVVEEGKVSAEQTPTSVRRLDVSLGSPSPLPPGWLPPFRGSDACFMGEGFTLSVVKPDGSVMGREVWNACEHWPILPDGCQGPPRGQGVNIGRILGPRGDRSDDIPCIAWEDRADDETAFRVVLEFGGGEKFEYTAPPNTVEFIPPATDVEGLGKVVAGNPRKDFGVTVWAVRPAGESLMGSIFIQVG